MTQPIHLVAPLALDELFWAAQRALRVNQRGLAARLGVSVRSLQRWSAGKTAPRRSLVAELARQLAPVERELAARAADLIGNSLDALVPPDSTTGAESAVAVPRLVSLAVDGLVLAVAGEVGVAPEKVRQALREVVLRAEQVGIGFEQLTKALGT